MNFLQDPATNTNILGGKLENPFSGNDPEEPEETAQHCNTHLRFRRHCLDCLRVVAAI